MEISVKLQCYRIDTSVGISSMHQFRTFVFVSQIPIFVAEWKLKETVMNGWKRTTQEHKKEPYWFLKVRLSLACFRGNRTILFGCHFFFFFFSSSSCELCPLK